MSFFDAVKSAFSNYCKFDGRARRSEYWYFVLFNAIVSVILSLLGQKSNVFMILSCVFSLAVLLPELGLSWRRMHDIGKSGAWNFLVLVPIVGTIIVIIWSCRDSEPGTNQYGPNPKGM